LVAPEQDVHVRDEITNLITFDSPGDSSVSQLIITAGGFRSDLSVIPTNFGGSYG
jgi:hypothetical protein